LLGGVAVLFFSGGLVFGNVVHRTLFYTPHFTSGVATYLVWKKLYNPSTGPINRALQPVLDTCHSIVTSTPPMLWKGAGLVVLLAGVAFLVKRLVGLIKTGETGSKSLFGFAVSAVVVLAIVVCLGQFLAGLPERATAGFTAPQWLSDYVWAKPALILMGLWAAVGSNNMLLYLAGLSSIPQELYEAADIDGASKWQRFWNVTWPQLMPVTFFIVTISLIYGLQGGFEMARTMTQGGPAGSTTTLSYYVYTEAFEAGRLGHAAAISWMLFVLVFVVTLLNWKLGKSAHSDE
jgi:multiple sugar transport system permease protein